VLDPAHDEAWPFRRSAVQHRAEIGAREYTFGALKAFLRTGSLDFLSDW